jgi:ABC-type nitrate/sulfonate/bicarbonate transport system substrate-binding protein
MLTIGYSALGVSLPVFAAHRTGLFADQGLRVKMRGYPTAHPMVEAIMDDGVPCGGFVAFPIALHRHVRSRPLYYACAVAEDLEKGAAPFERRPPVRPFTTVAHLNGARTC